MTGDPAILFDIGNVLFCDPWETLFLSPQKGLADSRGLDRQVVERIGRELWYEFSTRESGECSYWREVEKRLDIRISPADITQLEEQLLFPNPHAETILQKASDTGRSIGIASNNTSFWFAKQRTALSLDRYVDPKLVFLSHVLGVEKGAVGQGLIEIAAAQVDVPASFFVDDRESNLDRAQNVGFTVIRYSMTDRTPIPSFS